MSSLDNIAISIEQEDGFDGHTLNVQPVLVEIKHALDRFLEQGETSIIDLAALPFSEADEAQLKQLLGKGEISAQVDTLGISSIQETAIHGVWIVDHQGADEKRLALHIEITDIPEILKAPSEDMQESRLHLDEIINKLNSEPQEAPQ